jgi:hypothetical protein
MNDIVSAPTATLSVGANRTGTILALLTTVGFFSLLGFFAWREIPAGSRDLINIMLGTLSGGWTAVVSYYFGSSVGRVEAPQAMDRLGSGAPATPKPSITS